MQPYKKSFSFIDTAGLRARIDAEITNRNGYPEFTASGTYDNGGGQCLDRIKTKTSKQTEFIELWQKYHLKNVSKIHNFREHLEGIIAVIEYEEKEYEAQKEEKTGDEKTLEIMEEEGISDDMLDAVKAYMSLGIESDDGLENFTESYSGQFSSDEAFAKDMADNLGSIDKNATWPQNCIDWKHSARELMMDYSEADGYYFRNI